MSSKEHSGYINMIKTYYSQKNIIKETLLTMIIQENERLYNEKKVDIRYSYLISGRLK